MERWPELPWLEPIPVSNPGGPQRFGCRLCIARYGLKGENVERLFTSRLAVKEHLRSFHELSP